MSCYSLVEMKAIKSTFHAAQLKVLRDVFATWYLGFSCQLVLATVCVWCIDGECGLSPAP